MTRKQRAAAYRLAAERIFEIKGEYNSSTTFKTSPYACHQLVIAVGMRRFTKSIFPEFLLFKPLSPDCAWWDVGEYEERTLALLFAEQIALNP